MSIRTVACPFDSSSVSAVAAGGLAVSDHDRRSRREHLPDGLSRVAARGVVTSVRSVQSIVLALPFPGRKPRHSISSASINMEVTSTGFQPGKSEH